MVGACAWQHDGSFSSCAHSTGRSYVAEGITWLYDNKKEKGKKFLHEVVKYGHHSVIEHATFSIAFEEVSSLFHQFLIEHRLASYTIRSKRYVDFSNIGQMVPEYFKDKPELKYRAYNFSIGIIKFVSALPNQKIYRVIVDQLLRSATSIGANVTEAQAASSKRDFIKFYEIALKSANETKY